MLARVTTRRDRIEGGLLGLLIGDALGVPYEFHPPHQLPPLEQLEMTPPLGFRRAHAGVLPGTWSDDGAHALCLLQSLLTCRRLDLHDFGQRMVAWIERGHLAVDGKVFDVGIQTRTALQRLANGVSAEHAGPNGERDNGNGSLMRVLPLALWHHGSDAELITDAMRSSLPTHGHLRSQLCCALYCLWARALLDGEPLGAAWTRACMLLEYHARTIDGGLRELDVIDLRRPPGGSGGGYVVDCLHSARAALAHADYESVVKHAIALGNDTDTTAAVAGGLAGVLFGVDAIPARWRQQLRGRELLDPLLDALLDALDLGDD